MPINTNPATPLGLTIQSAAMFSILSLFGKEQQAINGYDLTIVRFRDVTAKSGTKSAGADLPAYSVYLPSVEAEINDLLNSDAVSSTKTALASVIAIAVSDERRNVVRSRVLSLVAEKASVAGTAIDWSSCSVAQCLTNIVTASESSKLTKESIEDWFNSSVVESVVERGIEICTARTLDASSAEGKSLIAAISNNYLAKYLKAASTVPGWQLEEGDALALMLARVRTAGKLGDVGNAVFAKIGTFLRSTRSKVEL